MPSQSAFQRFRPYSRDSIVPPPPATRDWEELMGLALEEADRASALGEVPVGALLVDPCGRILGRGHNTSIATSDVTAHAEINALRAAGQVVHNYRFPGCVLVVTLEPCTMCACASLYARLAGIVFGAQDAVAGGIISPILPLPPLQFVTQTWYMGGVLGDVCADRLARFFASLRSA